MPKARFSNVTHGVRLVLGVDVWENGASSSGSGSGTGSGSLNSPLAATAKMYWVVFGLFGLRFWGLWQSREEFGSIRETTEISDHICRGVRGHLGRVGKRR